MCSRQSRAEKGDDQVARENLILIQSRPKRALTLEEMHELQLAEQIELEVELSNILRGK